MDFLPVDLVVLIFGRNQNRPKLPPPDNKKEVTMGKTFELLRSSSLFTSEASTG
jgi:hypothetical protein